jgi:hypothetical protein
VAVGRWPAPKAARAPIWGGPGGVAAAVPLAGAGMNLHLGSKCPAGVGSEDPGYLRSPGGHRIIAPAHPGRLLKRDLIVRGANRLPSISTYRPGASPTCSRASLNQRGHGGATRPLFRKPSAILAQFARSVRHPSSARRVRKLQDAFGLRTRRDRLLLVLPGRYCPIEPEALRRSSTPACRHGYGARH